VADELYFNGAMPDPNDLALRERAVTAYERGDGSYAQLAALFDVDHRTLERWVARWRDTQSLAPQPRGGGWPCPIDVTVLRAVVRDRPDATVTELCWEYKPTRAEGAADGGVEFPSCVAAGGLRAQKKTPAPERSRPAGRRRETGKAHDFDARRIAATIRQHEDQNPEGVVRASPKRAPRQKKAS
jgi:transposase